MLSWIPRVLLAVFIGLAVFNSIHQLFKLNFWGSLALASFATLVTLLDGLKKVLDPIKLSLEISKLWREEKAARDTEQEKKFIVKSPTLDEIKAFGQSPVERILKDRFEKTSQNPLGSKQFITDTHEEKIL